MEIFYFNTQGEKIGPITKEGLINLAEAGVITEETVFEISGKKVKGKHIKNLRPIFEKQKEGGSAVTAADGSTFETPGQNLNESGIDAPEEIYQTAAQEAGPSDAAKVAYQHRMQKEKDNPAFTDTLDDSSTSEPDSVSRGKTKWFAPAFKKRRFPKFRFGKEKSGIPEPREGMAATEHDKRIDRVSKDRVFAKFWRGYRVLTIFLHIAFVILTLLSLAGMYKGLKWKKDGNTGYRSLNSCLENLLKTHKYEEFGREVDQLTDVHPFERIEGTLNKWNTPSSFEERTETLLSGKNDNIQSFEKMIAYLKKAIDVTHRSEVFEVELDVEKERDRINEEVKTAVEKQRDRVNDLRRQIAKLREPIQEQEPGEEPQEKPLPSTERSERKKEITLDEPVLPRDPRQRLLRELEEQLKREEERLRDLEEQLKKEEDDLRAKEAHLRELQSAASMKEKGKIIDTLAPEKAKPYETDEEIVVTPKSVGELHDVVHSYMKMMSVLFDNIHETGTNTYERYKTRAAEILGGYLLLLFLCYFTATRVRMAEETLKTRLILEERLISGNSNDSE